MADAPLNKRDEILDTAEAMMRLRGFNAFSTRDVANAVGVKAASVHYYFPTKADLGVAVAERYTARFMQRLGEPGLFAGRPKAALSHYAEAFRQALARDGKLCLCGVLGAEIGGLPETISAQVRGFFEKNIEWLTIALRPKGSTLEKARALATLVLASLEGALILSKSLNDSAPFARVETILARELD